jgi:hypothetical protein
MVGMQVQNDPTDLLHIEARGRDRVLPVASPARNAPPKRVPAGKAPRHGRRRLVRIDEAQALGADKEDIDWQCSSHQPSAK